MLYLAVGCVGSMSDEEGGGGGKAGGGLIGGKDRCFGLRLIAFVSLFFCVLILRLTGGCEDEFRMIVCFD